MEDPFGEGQRRIAAPVMTTNEPAGIRQADREQGNAGKLQRQLQRPGAR
jgi:hypothetical protein